MKPNGSGRRPSGPSAFRPGAQFVQPVPEPFIQVRSCLNLYNADKDAIVASPTLVPRPSPGTSGMIAECLADAELAAANRTLQDATPDAILRWAVDRFHPRLLMATAF